MIVHSITKPSGFLPYIAGVVHSVLPFRSNSGRQRMDKLTYTKWIEEVKQEFDVGELVTLKLIAETPNVLPMYYRITFIDEMCHNVPYDYSRWMPMALTCKTQQGVHICKCPDDVRHLTFEEIKLVTLSNTKPQCAA